MRFGVTLVNHGPGTDPSTLAGWVRLAEETGFHLAMLSDHIAVTPDVGERLPDPLYEPFTTLAWLAGLTERIELGTTVAVVPYRHPLITAKMAANIDRFSDGRLVLGVGVGWAEQEFAALGVPFGRRGDLTDEYLAVMREIWTSPVVSHDGEFVSFGEVRTAPPPVRVPPVWVGGSSPAAVHRAVRYGDAWHPRHPRVDWLRTKGIPALRAAADLIGRPLPALAPLVRVRVTETPLDEADRPACHGTTDQIRRDLAGFQEIGAAYIVFDIHLGGPLDDARETRRTLDALTSELIDLELQALR
ncbi:TIGR03619 family F420-dependent LLM class oxidoreductase [Rhizohabitans arisaemae]|uniref:TIGR03619 family F420-dependent LLM class oxidoreductase n=1 Tax=Rhizohabitans arisaemae TaxID=2720610 RepID=UPI0024B0AB42|nr:TIGR03619 family F420-dependent LLM class oxidoreductase [Rhizohabitans arisaemae]